MNELTQRLFYRVGNPSAWPEGFDESGSELFREAVSALEAQEDRIKALTTALDRQCDNMAFVLNRVDLHAWHGRFSDDLEADRLTLSKAPSIK